MARVGSALAEVRDVIQVRLDEGEQVELLEPPSGNSPWRKIAPPSGEFRWVFSKFVDRELPADLAEDERAADGPSRRDDAPADEQKRDNTIRVAGHDGGSPVDEVAASR